MSSRCCVRLLDILERGDLLLGDYQDNARDSGHPATELSKRLMIINSFPDNRIVLD
jgi:hypothetical protein